MPILPPLGGFGAISDFRDFQKGFFWATFSAKKSTFGHPAECRKASGKRPCAERPSKTYSYRLFSIFGTFGHPFDNLFRPICPKKLPGGMPETIIRPTLARFATRRNISFDFGILFDEFQGMLDQFGMVV